MNNEGCPVYSGGRTVGLPFLPSDALGCAEFRNRVNENFGVERLEFCPNEGWGRGELESLLLKHPRPSLNFWRGDETMLLLGYGGVSFL